MLTIRESNYQIINNEVYIGIELESKGTSFYKNSTLKISFYKDGKLIKEDDTYKIPYVIGEGIIYAGNKYQMDIEFDNLKVDLILGEEIYEETNYSKIFWEFEQVEENKLTYKFISHSDKPLDFATLNLVFFNKGELVCGSSVTKENLLNERKYYFEYEIPSEIEYTEVYPFFFIANTNHLLFSAFYQKHNEYQNEIEKLKLTKKEKLDNVKFDNKENNYNQDINKYKNDINILKTKKEKLISSDMDDLLTIMPIIGIAGYIILLVATFLINLLVIGYINYENPSKTPIKDLPIFITPAIGVGIILGCMFIYILIYSIKENIKSKKDNKKEIVELENKIKRKEEELEKYKNNIEEIKNNIKEQNDKINSENNQIDLHNQEINNKISEYKEKINNLINEHSEYHLDAFTNYDKKLIEEAIELGCLYYSDIIAYIENIKAEEARIRELQEKERKENMRQQELINRLSSLEQELVISQEETRHQLQENARLSMEQTQQTMNQMAYISQQQANALNKVNESIKNQGIDTKRIYNHMRYY